MSRKSNSYFQLVVVGLAAICVISPSSDKVINLEEPKKRENYLRTVKEYPGLYFNDSDPRFKGFNEVFELLAEESASDLNTNFGFSYFNPEDSSKFYDLEISKYLEEALRVNFEINPFPENRNFLKLCSKFGFITINETNPIPAEENKAAPQPDKNSNQRRNICADTLNNALIKIQESITLIHTGLDIDIYINSSQYPIVRFKEKPVEYLIKEITTILENHSSDDIEIVIEDIKELMEAIKLICDKEKRDKCSTYQFEVITLLKNSAIKNPFDKIYDSYVKLIDYLIVPIEREMLKELPNIAEALIISRINPKDIEEIKNEQFEFLPTEENPDDQKYLDSIREIIKPSESVSLDELVRKVKEDFIPIVQVPAYKLELKKITSDLNPNESTNEPTTSQNPTVSQKTEDAKIIKDHNDPEFSIQVEKVPSETPIVENKIGSQITEESLENYLIEHIGHIPPSIKEQLRTAKNIFKSLTGNTITFIDDDDNMVEVKIIFYANRNSPCFDDTRKYIDEQMQRHPAAAA